MVMITMIRVTTRQWTQPLPMCSELRLSGESFFYVFCLQYEATISDLATRLWRTASTGATKISARFHPPGASQFFSYSVISIANQLLNQPLTTGQVPFHVDLHKEMNNPLNLHNFGSVDRILLGLVNWMIFIILFVDVGNDNDDNDDANGNYDENIQSWKFGACVGPRLLPFGLSGLLDCLLRASPGYCATP